MRGHHLSYIFTAAILAVSAMVLGLTTPVEATGLSSLGASKVELKRVDRQAPTGCPNSSQDSELKKQASLLATPVLPFQG